MTRNGNNRSEGAERERVQVEQDLPSGFAHWRKHAAECFDEALRSDMAECVDGNSSTDAQWIWREGLALPLFRFIASTHAVEILAIVANDLAATA
jgi:hypothetical protein